MTRTKKRQRNGKNKKGGSDGNQEVSEDAKGPAPVITTLPTGHGSGSSAKLVGIRTSQQGWEPFIKSSTGASISWTLREKVDQWVELHDCKMPTWLQLGDMLYQAQKMNDKVSTGQQTQRKLAFVCFFQKTPCGVR